MSLDPATKRSIASSNLYLCIIPESGLAGTVGMEQLLYAVSLKKPILYWVPPGRDVAVPDYPGVVVRGNEAEVARAIREFLETNEPLEVVDGGY